MHFVTVIIDLGLQIRASKAVCKKAINSWKLPDDVHDNLSLEPNCKRAKLSDSITNDPIDILLGDISADISPRRISITSKSQYFSNSTSSQSSDQEKKSETSCSTRHTRARSICAENNETHCFSNESSITEKDNNVSGYSDELKASIEQNSTHSDVNHWAVLSEVTTQITNELKTDHNNSDSVDSTESGFVYRF